MPVCQGCFGFVEEVSDRCPSCGLERDENADEQLGRALLESIDDEAPGLRPTLLILPIAGIPLVFGLWRLALGTQVLQETFAAIFGFALIGGTSVGGLVYMLLREQRGYEASEGLAWWIAGVGSLATPLAVAAARFLSPEANFIPAALLFGAVQWLLSVAGASRIPEHWRTGRRGIPHLGAWLCLAWMLAPLLLILPRFT